MTDNASLADKNVLITGASSGFGAATARAVVARGARVILGARRTKRLADLVEELGEDSAVYSRTDVTNRRDLIELTAVGIDRFGCIDALVNNAGIMPLSFLDAGRVDEWDQMIDVNIKGVLWAIHAVLEHMLERGSGQIVNVSSVAGWRVMPSSAVYSATKYAVRAISEGLRRETAGKIQVTNISPGAFDTELANSVGDPKVRAHLDRFKGTLQPAERVAEAIVFALSQDPGVAINELTIRATAEVP